MLSDADFQRLYATAEDDPHALRVLLDTTRAELLDVDRQRAHLVDELAHLVDDFERARNEWADDSTRLLTLGNSADDQARRWRSRFEVLARAAVPFFDDWLSLYVRFQRSALNAEAQEMHRTAEEMTKLIASCTE